MVSLIRHTPDEASVHITLRLRYEKLGALAYISHLDLLRTMTKALLRAGLPLYYSEGFSPHPKLAFAAPLAVGQESVCEYLDVRLASMTDPTAAMQALNATLPSGLRITAAGYPAAKFTAVGSATYRITLRTAGADAALAARCEALLNAKPLTVFKRSKAGDRDVDVSPCILSATAGLTDEGSIEILLTLAAEGGAFLNTDYLLQYLREQAGILSGDPLTEAATVLRIALTSVDGERIGEGEDE